MIYMCLCVYFPSFYGTGGWGRSVIKEIISIPENITAIYLPEFSLLKDLIN